MSAEPKFTEPEPEVPSIAEIVDRNMAAKRERLERWTQWVKTFGAIGCTMLVLLMLGGIVSFGYVLVHFLRKWW